MQILIFAAFFTSISFTISCNNESQMSNSQEKTAITSETKESLPKVSFEVKILSKNNLQEGTHGDNSETELIFNIDGAKVDSFKEFGTVEIETDENGNVHAYYASDLSQNTISSEIIDGNTILLSKVLFFDGEERSIWSRTYTKSNGKWDKSKCEGECED
jgi:hypothetical protein